MHKKNLQNYLDDLASNKPAPGGGSSAALVGALGAALLSKVANFTIGKDKYRKVEKETRDILEKCEGIRANLTLLCSQDALAYEHFAQAMKLPKGPDRQKKVQQALKEATTVPLGICKDTHQAVMFVRFLAQEGNRNLITDVIIGGMFLEYAFKAAVLNVEINLKGIKDGDFILKVREVLEPMQREMDSLGGNKR